MRFYLGVILVLASDNSEWFAGVDTDVEMSRASNCFKLKTAEKWDHLTSDMKSKWYLFFMHVIQVLVCETAK